MNHHPTSFDSLSTILIIFTIAGVLVPIFQKFKISPILGYLICGLVIGPFGIIQFEDVLPPLHYFTITDMTTVTLLGEIGIIFLMFMIGLELSLRRLFDMRRLVLGLGTAQIVVTALVIAAFVMVFGNNVQTAIVVGVSFALSSTAIVMQLLREQHQFNRPTGGVSFAILLMQDLAVVPLLVILGGMAVGVHGGINGDVGGGTNLALLLSKSLVIAAVVVVVIYLAGSRILKPVMTYLSLAKNPEWLVSLVFLVTLSSALLTQSFGLSAALGAFLTGLLIAETDFRHEVEMIIEPVKSLLLGIFFLSVGMQVDLVKVAEYPFWLPVAVLGLFVVKVLCLYPLTRIFKIPHAIGMDVSVRLAQAGEFALFTLGVATATKIIPSAEGQFFLLVGTLSLFMTPLLSKLAPLITKRLRLSARDYEEASQTDGEESYSGKPHVLIAGYGRVGRILGNMLEQQEIPFIAIESNFEKVRMYKSEGHRVVFADARKIDIWRKLDAESVKLIVIALDNPESAEMILKALRAEYPHIPVIARTHDTLHMEHLYQMGATEAIPEAVEASLIIATRAMKLLGLGMADPAIIDALRRKILLKHADITDDKLG